MHKISKFKIFLRLLYGDFLEFRNFFIDKMIDRLIWVFCSIFIIGYIFSSKYNNSDLLSLQLAGCVAITGLMDSYGNVFKILSDFNNNKVINYYLTLPIKSIFIFIKIATTFLISFLYNSIIVIIMGKIILWNNFSLSSISIFKLFLILLLSNTFYSFLSLFIVVLIGNINKIASLWTRIVFPMWYLGGFQFKWIDIYNFSKYIGYIFLLNPIIYITEATKIALINSENCINFWICLLIIIIYTSLIAIYSINKLKAKLDYV